MNDEAFWKHVADMYALTPHEIIEAICRNEDFNAERAEWEQANAISNQIDADRKDREQCQ